jgi:hypothetical protein
MKIARPSSLYFKSNENGVLKLYANGKLYCERPHKKGQIFKINVPFNGDYTHNEALDDAQFFKVTPIEKDNRAISLPEPERNKKAYIKSIFFDNQKETPARIYTDLNTIVVNHKFFNYPIEIRFFILLHEVGHFYYSTEWKCDQFAAHHFLKIGFNPSQAFESLAGVLHETKQNGTENTQNTDRINRIFNLLSK